ncbi:BnaA05g20320D [Brassica napus]|uniref:BnaA05g20320D protein n=1 Tax=Brassica napus TaxID=3708 RepID=A0A078G2H4_BRANA|nr:BnaA05g20320D [Brassica napus]
MASIKERDEIALSQNTIALKGFALAIQLVMVAAVPALTEVVQDSCSSSDSDSEDIDGSGRDIFTKKRTLNPAHARNLDKRTDVIVHSILVQDPERPIDEAILVRHDEVHDSRVDNLVEAIRRNYQFNNSCFRGGIRKIDVVHMREKVKSSAKCKRPKKDITTSSEAENSVIVDLVLDKIKPQIDVLESNIKIGSSRVDAIEGGVRKQVETLLGKFKGEMLSSLKDIVSEVCKDHLAAHNGPGNYQPSSPTNLIVPRCHTSHVADANAKTIENVLRDTSQYSTPPRSNRICESVNPTPTKKQQVESGNVCGTPVIQSGAQSANSENRSRQQSFQQKLTPQNNKDNIADEPSFSLGLTQDEQIQEDIPILGQTCPDHVQLSHTNVDDNIEGISSSRRSKRQKTVPSGLVEDYLCGPHLLSRAKESQRSIFATLDISELVRKFTNLEYKMKSNL